MENKIIVIGIATGSREIETWAFGGINDPLLKPFCETLVRETGHKAWIVEGKILGKYEFDKAPVVFSEKSI